MENLDLISFKFYCFICSLFVYMHLPDATSPKQDPGHRLLRRLVGEALAEVSFFFGWLLTTNEHLMY